MIVCFNECDEVCAVAEKSCFKIAALRGVDMCGDFLFYFSFLNIFFHLNISSIFQFSYTFDHKNLSSIKKNWIPNPLDLN